MLVLESAVWMACESSCAVSFDSFPPLRMAAFPEHCCVNDLRSRACVYRRTRLDRQSSDIHDYFGARLKDHQEDSDRAGDPVQLQSVVELGGVRDFACRIWEIRHIDDALQHRIPLVAFIQVKSLYERTRLCVPLGFVPSPFHHGKVENDFLICTNSRLLT